MHRPETSGNCPELNRGVVLVIHNLPVDPGARPLANRKLLGGPGNSAPEPAHCVDRLLIDLHAPAANEQIGIHIVVGGSVFGLGFLDRTFSCAEAWTDNYVALERTGWIVEGSKGEMSAGGVSDQCMATT